MKCIYRGIEYTTTRPVLTATSSEIIGMYRGAPCRRQHVEVDRRRPIHQLMYRGVPYTTGGAPSASRPVAAESSTTVGTPAPAAAATAFFQRSVRSFSELDQIHTASIRKNLEERIATAKAQGNQRLVQLLEVEARELSLTV